MTINFNSFPYYDDYNPDKNFYKVLFKPGFAVQARELNQLQSISQHQISSFANHIFKKNSMVIPGGIVLNSNANMLFITDINPAQYLGKTITNAPLVNGVYPNTDGYFDDYITAVVLGYKEADTEYPASLYIKYFNSYKGTDNNDPYRLEFINTDLIYTTETTPAKVTVDVLGTSIGKVASIDKGVFYTKELFVDVAAQNIIIEVDNKTITHCNIGLNIIESIIDYSTDDSLLDNAQGYPNQYAPGADRYKVELILSKYNAYSELSDDNFIKLMSIENNIISYLNNNTQYSELMKVLAKRTYDANGNFIVNGLNTVVTRSNDDNYVWASVGRGTCYLGGYEYNQIIDKNIPILKPRDDEHIEDIPFVSTYSDNMPYFYAAAGNHSVNNNLEQLMTYTPEPNEMVHFVNAMPTANSLNVVGYGVFKELQYYLGGIGAIGDKTNAIVKMFFDDIYINSGYTMADIGGFVKIGSSLGAPILHELSISTPPQPIDFANDSVKSLYGYYVNSSTGITTEQGTIYYYGDNKLYLIKRYNNYKIPSTSVVRPTEGIALNVLSSFVSNYNDNFNPIIKVADSTIKTIKKKNIGGTYENVLSYSTIVKYSGILVDNFGTIGVTFTTSGSDYFEDFSTADYSAFIKSTENGAITNYLELSTNNISFDSEFKTLNFTTDDVSLENKYIVLYTTQIKENVAPVTKTLTSATIIIPTPSSSWMALGHQNVESITSIKDSGDILISSDINAVDITSRFILDSGSTANGIYTGLIKLKRNVAKPIGQLIVTYKYYKSSTNGYYASVDSYQDNNDGDVSYIGKIPNVYDTNRNIIPIRNYIDYRTTYSNHFFKNYGRRVIGENKLLLKDLNLSYYDAYYDYLFSTPNNWLRAIGPGIENGVAIIAIGHDNATGDTIIYLDLTNEQQNVGGYGTYYVGLTPSYTLTNTNVVNSKYGMAVECIYPKDLARITYAYTKYKPKHIHLYVNRDDSGLTVKYNEVLSYQEIVQYVRNEYKLPLAYIYLAPYTVDINDISIQLFENPVYKMLDIHSIKERVDRNEYYTSLALNKDMHQEILDANNEDQNISNRGFWNEDFEDAFSQDYHSDDYKCTLYDKSHVAPGTTTRTLNLSQVNTEASGNYKVTGSTITLPYTYVRAFGCNQASTFNNLNPYNVMNWQGKLTLNPMVDNWVDTVTLPVVIRPVIIKDIPAPTPVSAPKPTQPIEIIPEPKPIPKPIEIIPPPPTVIHPPPIVPPPPAPIVEIVTEINNLRTAWGRDSAGGYHAITFDWKTNLGRTGRVNSDKHLSPVINTRGFDGTYAKTLLNQKYELIAVKEYLNAGTHFDQKAPNLWYTR